MAKNDTTISIASQPSYAWKAKLIDGVYYMVEEGKQPNRFHRKMQELLFGIEWERVNDKR